MIIMGIETSCDETAVAIIEASSSEVHVQSNIISSQIALHAPFGGVVPALAAREHADNIGGVLKTALETSGVKHVDLIAVTSGPGLISSLLVGTAFAQTYAWHNQIPIIDTNHIEGHVYSNWLPTIDVANAQTNIQLNDDSVFPALCLIVSGGHTELVLMRGHGQYELIGRTVDDAAGEAFDKIARIIELGYPGGPALAKSASQYQPSALSIGIKLPRPMLNSGNYDFSFSGLKTSVLYKVRDLLEKHSLESVRNEVAHEAQEAIVDTLVTKTIRAAQEYNAQSILLAGGVSANELLRTRLLESASEHGIRTFIPGREYTTDNAAMIAMAGYFNYQTLTQKAHGEKLKALTSWEHIKANANWEIV